MGTPLSQIELSQKIEQYLQSWGLKLFKDEPDYFAWQRSVLSPTDLSSLQQLIQYRQDQNNATADIQFYDLAANPDILPVLYSQRYNFFAEVAVAIAPRLSAARQVLDFGCGVGILTTFWATLFPDIEFVGIDRSSHSIDAASQQVAQRGLQNIRFECCQIPHDKMTGTYDCLVSTHALFQAEDSPGLCSADWNTFERNHDAARQLVAEETTGIGKRMDALCELLAVNGKMVLCEKTRHLGRRVLLQQAFARRGFYPVSTPVSLGYEMVGVQVEDGPLYEIVREGQEQTLTWHEKPEWKEGQSLYDCSGVIAGHMVEALGIFQRTTSHDIQLNHVVGCCTLQAGIWRNAIAYGSLSTTSGFQGLLLGSVRDIAVIVESWKRFAQMTESEILESIQQVWGKDEATPPQDPVPAYENHTIAAQEVWSALPDRTIQEEQTFREPDGRAMHVELGKSGPLTYIYWANTYDQRQLMLVGSLHDDWLVAYYQESLADMQTTSHF
ncbi:methyltransferase domain-containing protein [Nitrospira sp. M1]